MTTSNHRPYTYPSGKIDIPSHTGRDGAVKYADYAVGKFLEEARGHSWFDDTIFVFVADHCASSAGKTKIPVEKYHIPMAFYSPKNIKPQTIELLASQIDFAPTLMSLVGGDYKSSFYGHSLTVGDTNNQRALLGTYQNISLLKPSGHLTVLSPLKKANRYLVRDGKSVEVELDKNELKETIAYYQSADYLFKNSRLKRN